ncbi:MAG TPA: DUF4386 domain-containing protein [Candidatus Eisenbacteria bacterium]|nr:DUF4386 domain-containing protein [Candidatus Eisenbacteria bacterium]
MNSRKATARQAGILYFLFMLIAIYGEFLLPNALVPGDAAATSSNITRGEFTYRMGILVGLATHVIFLFLVVVLYKLFEDVNKSQALLMVVLVSVGVAVALANMLNRFAPLQILSGEDYLSAFTREQLDALTMSSLRFRSSGSVVPTAFWGFWLFPFGLLVMKSGFIPRLFGILLLVAGTAYVVGSATAIILPEHRQLVSKILMPFYLGEVPVVFWLLLKGAKESHPAAGFQAA